jgi:hypothetical protein
MARPHAYSNEWTKNPLENDSMDWIYLKTHSRANFQPFLRPIGEFLIEAAAAYSNKGKRKMGP